MNRLTARLKRAALETLRRRARSGHPDGNVDGAGRWYPSAAESCNCCNAIRQPSRSWPWSLMTHCRTITHIANKYAYDVKLLRWAVARVEKEGSK
jgi:hypothetical protein